jgi:predicted patatin/cPLA2 family phospholipase
MVTAWVFPGGGSHGAYTAGAVIALHTLGVPEPDIIIASSGSSGTAAYFVARQYSSLRRIWCELLSTKKFGNPLRFWKLMDVDYLIDCVIKIQEPLDVEIVYQSPVRLYVPLTDMETGEIRYFENDGSEDFFELLRAAKSAPFFSGIFSDKGYICKGKKYLDSRISSRPARNIEKAVALGAKKIVVLDNYHPKTSWTNGLFWYRLLLLVRPARFRKLHLRFLKQDVRIPNNVEVVYFKPQKSLRVAVWNNAKQKMHRVFNQGFYETTTYTELIRKICSSN